MLCSNLVVKLALLNTSNHRKLFIVTQNVLIRVSRQTTVSPGWRPHNEGSA